MGCLVAKPAKPLNPTSVVPESKIAHTSKVGRLRVRKLDETEIEHLDEDRPSWCDPAICLSHQAEFWDHLKAIGKQLRSDAQNDSFSMPTSQLVERAETKDGEQIPNGIEVLFELATDCVTFFDRTVKACGKASNPKWDDDKLQKYVAVERQKYLPGTSIRDCVRSVQIYFAQGFKIKVTQRAITKTHFFRNFPSMYQNLFIYSKENSIKESIPKFRLLAKLNKAIVKRKGMSLDEILAVKENDMMVAMTMKGGKGARSKRMKRMLASQRNPGTRSARRRSSGMNIFGSMDLRKFNLDHLNDSDSDQSQNGPSRKRKKKKKKKKKRSSVSAGLNSVSSKQGSVSLSSKPVSYSATFDQITDQNNYPSTKAVWDSEAGAYASNASNASKAKSKNWHSRQSSADGMLTVDGVDVPYDLVADLVEDAVEKLDMGQEREKKKNGGSPRRASGVNFNVSVQPSLNRGGQKELVVQGRLVNNNQSTATTPTNSSSSSSDTSQDSFFLPTSN